MATCQRELRLAPNDAASKTVTKMMTLSSRGVRDMRRLGCQCGRRGAPASQPEPRTRGATGGLHLDLRDQRTTRSRGVVERRGV